MKLLVAIIFTLASVGALLAAEEEANLPVASSVTNTDKVRIVKGGASMSAPASLIRQIMASQITDATVVGRNWITTTSPSAVTFPMVNSDNTVSYLNAGAFLAAIGAGSAVVTIRETDTVPSIVFNVLEVSDGTLTDMGGGVARITIGAGGGGGGGTWGSIIGTLSDQTDLQAALDAKLAPTGNGSSLTNLTFTQLGGSATDAQIPDNITVSLATVATTANAGDSATDFFASGQIERARGGTGADTSAYGSGLFGSDGSNATVDVDTIAEFSAALGLTGTPSSSTFMRGDGTWASPASGGGGDMLAANNLSDLINFATARANLGVAIGVNVLAPNGDGSALTGFTDAQIPAAIARDAEVAAAYQPLDADLTAIAALATTPFGRGLLDDADATAARVTLGLVIGTNVLAPNGNGSALTGLTFTQLGGAATDAQVPDTITIDLATSATTATTATTANAGDSATAFFTSGQIERARGGTAADTSAYGNALLGSDVSNATVDVDTIGEFSTAIGVTGSPSAANFLRGDGTWSAPSGAGTVTATGGNLTNNAIMLGAGTTDSKVLASLGTTTTVLHGNAAGAPSFGAVSLTADVSGVLPDANIDTAITRDSEAAAAYQPLDSDLTSIAALTTAAFGRGLLDDANAAAGRTSFELATPTGWATTDKLVTVGIPSGGIAPLRLDAGTGGYVDTQPVGSASDISLTFAPKGTASVIQFTNSAFTTGFGITGTTFAGGGGIPAGAGITFFLGGTYYPATAAGFSLLDDADTAAQRVTLGLNNIASFTSSLGISGTASSSTFLRGDGSWTAVTASAPGSNTEVVFNDGGILGSDSGLTWNKITDTLNIANMTVSQLNAVNFKVLDTNQSHGLSWVVNGDWTADKTFTYTGEFTFALTLGANSTLAMSGDAITFADNVRQTFNPGITTPGFNFGSYPGDPSGASNGDAWYDSTGNLLRTRINGVNVSLGTGGVSDGDKGEVVVSGSGATWLLDDGFAASGAVLTSPRVVTNLLDTNGNEFFVLTATASAVNEITYSNGSAGNNPKFLASGDEAAVGIDFQTKGAAGIRFLGNSTQSARFRMHEDTDNGTNQVSLVAPAAITSDIDVELPATAGTLLVSSGPLGTPSSGTLTNATGLPISTGVSGLGTGVATALVTPSSANLRTAVTDEVGTGSLMFTRTGVLRTVYINAGAMIARSTNGAAAATLELATNDIMFDSFDFDSTTSEGVGFWWTPPTTYNAGTVTVKFNWTAASGSGTATWSISARAFGDDDAMDQALGTAQAVTDTLITANDMHVTATTSALTIAGTPAANKPVYWQITRDVADTLSSDAKLIGCTIEYTESSTEPSAQ